MGRAGKGSRCDGIVRKGNGKDKPDVRCILPVDHEGDHYNGPSHWAQDHLVKG